MRIVIRKTVRVRAIRLQLFLAAAIMGGSGVGLVALSRSDDPPKLEQLTREVGRLGEFRLHTAQRGAPYLEMRIGGLTYTVDSYDRAWIEAVRAALHKDDMLTVWGRKVPIGSFQIWQLAHGDSIIISIEQRSERKVAQNRKTIVMGEVLAGIGLMFVTAGLLVGGEGKGSWAGHG